jgi:hypothetical protein
LITEYYFSDPECYFYEKKPSNGGIHTTKINAMLTTKINPTTFIKYALNTK